MEVLYFFKRIWKFFSRTLNPTPKVLNPRKGHPYSLQKNCMAMEDDLPPQMPKEWRTALLVVLFFKLSEFKNRQNFSRLIIEPVQSFGSDQKNDLVRFDENR
jgi:hypothetical protein